MARQLMSDPYTPEELKAALKINAIADNIAWCGEHGIMQLAYKYICELEHRIDQLENEVTAVEWVNGRMERELEAALRKCG